MNAKEQISALHDIFDEMLERQNLNALARLASPIDLSPPTQHPSKAVFLREKKLVEKALRQSDALLRTLVPSEKQPKEDKSALSDLAFYLDTQARSKTKNYSQLTPTDVVAASARLVGLRGSLVWLLIDAIEGLQNRARELKDQEKEFWTVSNRPPNYYARMIALRTARVYAREKGEHPKFGSYRDGGHPSTSYAKALERIFEILEIDAKVRGPAEWAIGEITDDDLRPPTQHAMGGIFGSES